MDMKWVEQQSYAFPMFHGFFDHHYCGSGDVADLNLRSFHEFNMGNAEMLRYGSIAMEGSMMEAVDERGVCGEVSKRKGNSKRKIQGAESVRRKEKKGKVDADDCSSIGDHCGRSSKDAQKMDYIHVRARRGQATDSHSLAERARREKISKKMKYLQDLVPGCIKVAGRAGMLDEIINYVQSLQKQVEFLSMKLAAMSPVHHPIIQETEHPSCLENYVEINLTPASIANSPHVRMNQQEIERKSMGNSPNSRVPSAWDINHSSVPINPAINPLAFPLCNNSR